ncbi:hypothetical protein GGER_06430 [Serratia rubidaea]
MPLKNTPAVTPPLFGIPLFCLAALLFTLRSPGNYIKRLEFFSCVLGLLWAGHIYMKSQYLLPNVQNYLIISLFSIFLSARLP